MSYLTDTMGKPRSIANLWESSSMKTLGGPKKTTLGAVGHLLMKLPLN